MLKVKFIRVVVFVLVVIFSTLSCFSQDIDKPSTLSRRNAISLNIAGNTPLIGVTYERLLSDKFNVEVGLGLISVGAGIKYFPFPIADNKMVFHTGIGTNIFATPLDDFDSSDYSSTTYLMIGLSYFGGAGFNFAIDVGPSVNYDFTYNEVSNPFYGNLKLGYRF